MWSSKAILGICSHPSKCTHKHTPGAVSSRFCCSTGEQLWVQGFTPDPPRVSCELSAIVSTKVQGKTRMSLIKRLKCFFVGCNSEHSTRHLLPTSELLKMQKINVTFFFEGNAPIPNESFVIQLHLQKK